MEQPPYEFIIIDDDSCHNIVCALSLKQAFKSTNINITGFTDVMEGIRYIRSKAAVNQTKTVLFLDIYMPDMSGWDVLEEIEAMPKTLTNNLVVYMLSSALETCDREKASLYSFVKDCLQKPLAEHLLRITEELTENTLRKKICA